MEVSKVYVVTLRPQDAEDMAAKVSGATIGIFSNYDRAEAVAKSVIDYIEDRMKYVNDLFEKDPEGNMDEISTIMVDERFGILTGFGGVDIVEREMNSIDEFLFPTVNDLKDFDPETDDSEE